MVEDFSNSNLKVMYGLELKCCVIWRQEVGFVVVVVLFFMSEVKVEYDSALTNNTNNSRVE